MAKSNKFIEQMRASISGALDDSGMTEYLSDELNRVALLNRHKQTEQTTSPLKMLDRLREICQSREGYEGNYENWKNLQKIQGMSEELLADCLDECKYPALFLEDICRLDYSFSVPEWVAKIKDQTRMLAYFRASLVRGSVIPAEGYKSPVEAGLEALEASLWAAKERAERAAKCRAKRTLLAWWEAKPEDEQARLFLQPPSPFMAKIKHEYDEEHKDGQN